jgi:hypothetical protein
MFRKCLLGHILACAGWVWLALMPGIARAGSAEVKLEREYLAGLVEKMPPLPFHSEKSRGRIHGCRLVAIDARGRRFVVAGVVDGELRSLAGAWRDFRFEVRVGIHVEAGPDGTPRCRIEV